MKDNEAMDQNLMQGIIKSNQEPKTKLFEQLQSSPPPKDATPLDLALYNIYYSHEFEYFYLTLIIPCIILIGWLSYYWIFEFNQRNIPSEIIILEYFLNLILIVDAIVRIKIKGCSKYLRNNKIDSCLIIICISLLIAAEILLIIRK